MAVLHRFTVCVTLYYTLYESDLLAQGGGDNMQPKKSGPKQVNNFLPNKESMTEMKFSSTSLVKITLYSVLVLHKLHKD